jgi:hypothetical protein
LRQQVAEATKRIRVASFEAPKATSATEWERRIASVLDDFLDAIFDALGSDGVLTRDGIQRLERHHDGRHPHRMSQGAAACDAGLIAWECQACGEVVSEYKPRTPCPVDWRTPSDLYRLVPLSQEEPHG